VGAGIGGLSAAVALRRNGHEVYVGSSPPSTPLPILTPFSYTNNQDSSTMLGLPFISLLMPTVFYADGESWPSNWVRTQWITLSTT